MLGHLCGRVGQNTSVFEGGKCTNNAAELEALFWATCFAIQAFQFKGICQFGFGSDSFNSLEQMRGNAHHRSDLLCYLAGRLSLLYESLCEVSTVAAEHVYAHEGHAWNEL